jgi:hypothetical protein
MRNSSPPRHRSESNPNPISFPPFLYHFSRQYLTRANIISLLLLFLVLLDRIFPEKFHSSFSRISTIKGNVKQYASYAYHFASKPKEDSFDDDISKYTELITNPTVWSTEVEHKINLVKNKTAIALKEQEEMDWDKINIVAMADRFKVLLENVHLQDRLDKAPKKLAGEMRSKKRDLQTDFDTLFAKLAPFVNRNSKHTRTFADLRRTYTQERGIL